MCGEDAKPAPASVSSWPAADTSRALGDLSHASQGGAGGGHVHGVGSRDVTVVEGAHADAAGTGKEDSRLSTREGVHVGTCVFV